MGGVKLHAVSECFSCTATPFLVDTPSLPVSLRNPLPSLTAPSSLSCWMRIETVPVGFDVPPYVPTLQHIACPSRGPTLFAICCLLPVVLPPATHSISTAMIITPVFFSHVFSAVRLYICQLSVSHTFWSRCQGPSSSRRASSVVHCHISHSPWRDSWYLQHEAEAIMVDLPKG